MANSKDPFGSIFDSIQVALSPIESGFRNAAKDLEFCWKESENTGKLVELFARVNGSGRNREGVMCNSANRNRNGQCVVNGGRKLRIEAFLGGIFSDSNSGHEVEVHQKELKIKDVNKDNGAFVDCLLFAMNWPLMLDGVCQAFPSPFKPCEKPGLCPNKKKMFEWKRTDCGVRSSKEIKNEGIVHNNSGKRISIECSIGFMFDQLIQNLQKFGGGMKIGDKMECKSPALPSPSSQYDNWSKMNMNGILGNLKFARLGGVPSTIVEIASDEATQDGINPGNRGEPESNYPMKVSSGFLSVPLSNVERLRSTLSTISFTDFAELVSQPGKSSNDDHPDKKKLLSVQAFFKYAEAEGRRFFQELDRDGDGQITMEDLEVEMRKRKLPQRYARELIRRARSHLFSKSFGWKQFLSLMEQKEPMILRAYTSLSLSKSGKLQKGEILESLTDAGIPANEDNVVALMHVLNADTERSISYGHFRNLMLLLPSDQKGVTCNIWFKDSTAVADTPAPVKFSAGSVLRSALAGGLSCALSAALMHPIDTVKTRVQASTQLTFLDIMSQLPQIGPRGLYRGLIPTIVGQFSSHGLRTGLTEATKLFIANVAPSSISDIQVQSIASFGGTCLGTAMRIPCEVLKQRLQAGLYENVGEAAIGTWRKNGMKGLFRGTGVTLFREIPFYVAGTGLYEESKSLLSDNAIIYLNWTGGVAQRLLGRELEAWETITVGALSGGLTAVLTTPFDVIKTRMMISQQGQPLSMSVVAFSILHHEGILALFKGAVPRFFWVAPLGAMNLAGYELAKKALDKSANNDQ